MVYFSPPELGIDHLSEEQKLDVFQEVKNGLNGTFTGEISGGFERVSEIFQTPFRTTV